MGRVRQGRYAEFQKCETKVCGGTGYAVEEFRMSLGCGDAWIRVPVRCYMKCNNVPQQALE